VTLLGNPSLHWNDKSHRSAEGPDTSGDRANDFSRPAAALPQSNLNCAALWLQVVGVTSQWRIQRGCGASTCPWPAEVVGSVGTPPEQNSGCSCFTAPQNKTNSIKKGSLRRSPKSPIRLGGLSSLDDFGVSLRRLFGDSVPMCPS